MEVLNDIECHEFPWHPKPVLELTDTNAVQLNEGPCLVLFVGMEHSALKAKPVLRKGTGLPASSARAGHGGENLPLVVTVPLGRAVSLFPSQRAVLCAHIS